MKLEINYNNKTGKFTNTQRLNNVLLNKQWDQRGNYVCVYFICNETNENTNIKTMGCSKSSPKRKVSDNIYIYYEKK